MESTPRHIQTQRQARRARPWEKTSRQFSVELDRHFGCWEIRSRQRDDAIKAGVVGDGGRVKFRRKAIRSDDVAGHIQPERIGQSIFVLKTVDEARYSAPPKRRSISRE